MRLLICDRDRSERDGITWLIEAYSLPFQQVAVASTYSQMQEQFRQTVFDVLCIELELIPGRCWDEFCKISKNACRRILAVTTEPTFERAMQALELGAFTLLLKPLAPDKLQDSLRKALDSLQNEQSPPSPRLQERTNAVFSYEHLFLDDEKNRASNTCWLLIDPEYAPIADLHDFLRNLPFFTNVSIFPLSDTVVCLFSHICASTVKRSGRLILQEWEKRNHGGLCLTFFQPDSVMSIREAYRNAKKASGLKFFKGYRQIIETNEAPQWAEMDPILTVEEQKKWVAMLEEGEAESIKKWMYDNFLHWNNAYPDPGMLRIRLTSILAQVRRFMKSNGLNEERFENLYQQTFSSILYTPVLYRIVSDMLLLINDVLDGVREKRFVENDPVQKTLTFMSRHYAKNDLSLVQVAEYTGRSPTYLSSLIRKKTGRTFRSHLLEMRMDAARKRLSHTSQTIEKIARETGFKSGNYFSRVFKKIYGITPKQYRDRKKWNSS